MYYEERWIDGLLCFRTLPYAAWQQMSLERVCFKLREVQRALEYSSKAQEALANENARLLSILCDIKEKVEFEVGR